MRIDLHIMVSAAVLLALGAMGWRQARLSDELAELRREVELRPEGPVARLSHPGGRVVEPGAADARSATGHDIEALRGELDQLRESQAALQQELAGATPGRPMAPENARDFGSRLESDSPLPNLGLDTRLDTGLEFGLHAALSATPKGPRWGPQQVAGTPDTIQAADLPTAWASQDPDGGTEWLQLDYEQAVDLAEVRVHESFNPGAISKVAAAQPDGTEMTIWEGTMEAAEGSVESVFEVPPGLRGSSIRIYLDTARVKGWNEIDAVEVVGRDGSRQWATDAQASSYYGQEYGPLVMPAETDNLTRAQGR